MSTGIDAVTGDISTTFFSSLSSLTRSQLPGGKGAIGTSISLPTSSASSFFGGAAANFSGKTSLFSGKAVSFFVLRFSGGFATFLTGASNFVFLTLGTLMTSPGASFFFAFLAFLFSSGACAIGCGCCCCPCCCIADSSSICGISPSGGNGGAEGAAAAGAGAGVCSVYVGVLSISSSEYSSGDEAAEEDVGSARLETSILNVSSDSGTAPGVSWGVGAPKPP